MNDQTKQEPEMNVGDSNEYKIQERILKYFKYDHLPPHLQPISKLFCELAEWMVIELEACPERTAGLRKLLEAKDCMVRAKNDP